MARVCLQQNLLSLGWDGSKQSSLGIVGLPQLLLQLWFIMSALRKAPTSTQGWAISELHRLKMKFYFEQMSAKPFPLRCPSRQGTGAALGMCQSCSTSEPGMIWTSINEVVRGKKCSRDSQMYSQINILNYKSACWGSGSWKQLPSVT